MRLYKYFLKNLPPEDDDVEYTLSDQYPLYAFTADKKLAKRFEKERNMDKFIKIVSKVSREKYIEYGETNRNHDLSLYKLATSRKESESGVATLVMTLIEYQCVDPELASVALYDDNFWCSEYHCPPYVYKTKIQKALDFIDYSKIYKIYFNPDENVDADFDVKKIDQYNYFLDKFQDIFL